MSICPSCNGTGKKPQTNFQCWSCNGNGNNTAQDFEDNNKAARAWDRKMRDERDTREALRDGRQYGDH
jgi:DnaJ-class molecular chaperone